MKNDRRKPISIKLLIGAILGLLIICISVFIRINMIRTFKKATTDLCICNLRHIANAIDMYQEKTGFYIQNTLDNRSSISKILSESDFLKHDLTCPLNNESKYQHKYIQNSDSYEIICPEKHWYDETFFGKKKYYKAPIKYVEGKGIVTDPPLD